MGFLGSVFSDDVTFNGHTYSMSGDDKDLYKKFSADAEATATQQKYAKLNTDQTTVSQLVYPQNLLKTGKGLGHFVLFNFNHIAGTQFKSKVTKVENDGVVSSPFSQPVMYQDNANTLRKTMITTHKRSKESVAIYMPKDISTTYNADWQTSELGAAGAVLKTIKEFDQLTLSDVGNKLIEQSKNLATGAIQTLTPINAKDASELLTGTISNPFVEVLFKGVNNREFNMEFKFVPSNPNEARVVREIIRRFKFHMMPEFKYRQNDSSYLLHPSTVDVTFMKIDSTGSSSRNGWLHRMSTCAITNVTVNETPEGEYDVHHDDAPVASTMTITLTELEQMHKGRFQNPEDTF